MTDIISSALFLLSSITGIHQFEKIQSEPIDYEIINSAMIIKNNKASHIEYIDELYDVYGYNRYLEVLKISYQPLMIALF